VQSLLIDQMQLAALNCKRRLLSDERDLLLDNANRWMDLAGVCTESHKIEGLTPK
jgi:hypothetical protein